MKKKPTIAIFLAAILSAGAIAGNDSRDYKKGTGNSPIGINTKQKHYSVGVRHFRWLNSGNYIHRAQRDRVRSGLAIKAPGASCKRGGSNPKAAVCR